MKPDEMADLTAFIAVARERSFTRAAKQVGLSQSALSQIVRRLEARMGLRLLSRTTRSVAPTEAGERLMETMAPMLKNLADTLAILGAMREHPGGTIRITTVEHAASNYMAPALGPLLAEYHDINVELSIDYGLTDIVESRYDAGVRLGEQIERDMIAVRISPDIPMAVVATSNYLRDNGTPHHPRDLHDHRCINLRLPTSGGLYEWRFSKRGQSLKVDPGGQMVANALGPLITAARAGIGFANVPLDMISDDLSNGNLVRVLADWSENLPAYHLYYPNRRFASPAFKLVVDALRWRG